MGMGSLATVGLQKPGNLSIVVLDNECYGETGGQMSHTASAANLVGSRQACGIADARTLDTMARSRLWRTLQDVSAGPRFASVKIDAANLERVALESRRYVHPDPAARFPGLRPDLRAARRDQHRLRSAIAHGKLVALQHNTLTFCVCECLLTT